MNKRTCRWRLDRIDDFFFTDCDNAFQFAADGIVENKFEFCPYCGRKIKEVYFKEISDET